MPPKKIAGFTYYYPPKMGGIGRHLAAIAKNFNQTADFLYALDVFSPNLNALPEHHELYSYTANAPGEHLPFSLMLNFNLNKILTHEEYAAVLLPGGPGGIICIRKPNIPLIYIANHTYAQQIEFLPEQKWKKIFIPFERYGYQIASHIIAISTTTKESLLRSYAIPENKISVIPPGISDASNQIEWTKKDPASLLYVGRLDERKGFGFLLDAVELLSSKRLAFHLNVIGNGSKVNDYKGRVEQLGLSSKITFHGALSDQDLEQFYTSSSIQIIPSRLEGFGLVALEGIQHGATIVASRVPGLTDIIQDQQNGWLVEFANSRQLADALESLLTDTNLRQSLAMTAQQSLQRYQWSHLINKYRELFAQILS